MKDDKKKKNNSNDAFLNEFNAIRKELSTMFMQTREELSKTIGFQITESSKLQQIQLSNMTNINEAKLEKIWKKNLKK